MPNYFNFTIIKQLLIQNLVKFHSAKKAEIVAQNMLHSILVQCNHLIYTVTCCNLCFNRYTLIYGSHKHL